MFCNSCGKKNADDAEFCTFCGEKLLDLDFDNSSKPRICIEAVLSFVMVLGWPVLIPIVPSFYPLLLLPVGMVFAVVAIRKINRSGGELRGKGFAASAIAIFLLNVVFIVFSVFMLPRAKEAARRTSCQSNMRELGSAFSMYQGDYDNMLPSSYLYAQSPTWNADHYTKFVSRLGQIPLENSENPTMMELLYPHLKIKDVIFCPDDCADRSSPDTVVSYYYKAACDCAWYGGFQHARDFAYPEEQIIFWEHNDWHWSGGKAPVDDMKINAIHMDGHVAPKQIQDSGYTSGENPPGPLPKSGVGEPAWFNHNNDTTKDSVGANWNPKVYSDNLQ